MSVKDLKSIKEQCEQQKEHLRELTRLAKDTKIEVRRRINEIKELNIQISSLDSKGTNSNKNFYERSTLSAEEKDLYNKEFQKVSDSLFDKFKSRSEISKDKKEEVAVDVCFEKTTISFVIGEQTRFRDLRAQVSSYWSLPVDEIFFSDESPEKGEQAVFLLDNVVMSEIYVWNRIKLKNENFLLYLVLRNYNSLQNRMEELFPKTDQHQVTLGESEEIGLNLVSSKKKKQEKKKTKAEIVQQRRLIYFFQVLLQSLFTISLFMLWAFLLVTETDINAVSWSTSVLEQIFIYQFPSQVSNTNGVLGNQISSLLIQQSDTNRVYQYLDYIRTQFFVYNTGPGIIGDDLYSTEFIELRQVRTEIKTCNNSITGPYFCTDDFNWYKTQYTKDIGNQYSFQKYNDRDSGTYQYGTISAYPLSGYIAQLSVIDESLWNNTVQKLLDTNWFDEGTRAIFFQMDFVAPSTNVAISVIPFLEITSNLVFVPNFRMYYIQNSLYTDSRLGIHLAVFIIALFLITIEFINLVRHPDEQNDFNVRGKMKKSDSDLIYNKIKEHQAKKFCKKIRQPRFAEWVSFIVLFCVILLEIVTLGWYLTKYQDAIKNHNDSAKFFVALQGYSMMNDSRSIILLLLAVGVMRYIIIWLSKVSALLQIILYAFSQMVFYIVLAILPLFIFTVFFFYFLGPYDLSFFAIEYSFVSIISIFCGQWPSSAYFLNFVQSGFLVAVYFCFAVWKIVVLNFQIIILQSKLSEVRIGY